MIPDSRFQIPEKCMLSGIHNLEFGISNLEFGIWNQDMQ